MSPHCAQCFHPPTHWHSETCHEPRRGSSDFPHFVLRGTARLSFPARIGRALIYVRVLRARRMVWLLPSCSSAIARFFFQGVAWFGPQLRTSNDHCFIVGVP